MSFLYGMIGTLGGCVWTASRACHHNLFVGLGIGFSILLLVAMRNENLLLSRPAQPGVRREHFLYLVEAVGLTHRPCLYSLALSEPCWQLFMCWATCRLTKHLNNSQPPIVAAHASACPHCSLSILPVSCVGPCAGVPSATASIRHV